MISQNWGELISKNLQEAGQGFLNYIPLLIGALVIFILGWIVSCGIGKLIAEILKKLKFNRIFETGNWKEALAKAEIKVNPAEFVGAIFKWILVIVFLSIAVEILGLTQFTDFLKDKVLPYLGNVVIAVLVFVVAVIVADIVEKVVRAGVGGIRVGYSKSLVILLLLSPFLSQPKVSL